jgi:hypothetical protein
MTFWAKNGDIFKNSKTIIHLTLIFCSNFTVLCRFSTIKKVKKKNILVCKFVAKGVRE